MRGVNKVILVQRLTCQRQRGHQDLATSEQWTDKQTGQKVEKTEWHRVSSGKVSSASALAKARYTSRASWSLGNGKRTHGGYATEIIVDMQGTMQLLGHPEGQQARPQQQAPRQAAARPAQQAAGQSDAPPSFDDSMPW